MENKIYIIQNKITLRIHGCFRKKKDAENYINNDFNFAILELEVI